MTLNLMMTDRQGLKPRITVFGVGGAGGNAVNNMIDKELQGVEFVVANTDAQALAQSHATACIQMGVRVTEGLGAGARPAVGAAAAEETIEEIVDHLAGAHMCFITAGMGGGTGTGAAPIIAQAARELGVLTVGVVTKPFQFEGSKRMRQAEEGIEALQKVVDTLIIIPNQNLFRLANEKTTFADAFAMADDVLYQGVKGVTDLMVRPGLINLDFADVRRVMDEMGKAMMGTGEATGEDRAVKAAEKAIANPLLDEISLNGARGVLINVTGGYDITLFEMDEAANIIREKVDPDANIIVGSTLDTSMEGAIRVSVVATGIDAAPASAEVPVTRRRMAEPLASGATSAVARDNSGAAPAFQPASGSDAPLQGYTRQDAPAAGRRIAEPSLFAEDDDAVEGQPGRGPLAGDPPTSGYQPQSGYRPSAPMSGRAETARAETSLADAGAFVAPRPHAPGTPSPETMARLRAAIDKVPQRGAEAPAQRPVAQRSLAAERPKFGINTLINRITGQASDADGGQSVGRASHPPAVERRMPPSVDSGYQPARTQPPAMTYEDDPEPDHEQHRIEMPAFLRRQAN